MHPRVTTVDFPMRREVDQVFELYVFYLADALGVDRSNAAYAHAFGR